MNGFIYNKYSDYLKNKYNAKVYKLPINLLVSCPNRDGKLGFGGCTYCGEKGAGFECLPGSFSVKEQVIENAARKRAGYKATKFISYFQNYSNTYMPLQLFKEYMQQGIIENIVGLSISTRPDCINDEYLEFLQELADKNNLDITIELGLQTVNYHSLIKIKRGHTLAEYLDAVLRIKKFGFSVCTHIILNLPWDTLLDVIETSKIISALDTDEVKLHALFIVKGTVLAQQYLNNEFQLIHVDEYKERVKIFLEYLDPKITVQRLIGRAPKEDTLFVNWNTSWWKIRDEIEEEMLRDNRFQGKLFNYTNAQNTLI